MDTASAGAEAAAPAMDDQFLALVCNDADLLDAEFEAIVAAEWPVPPEGTPPRSPEPVRPLPSVCRPLQRTSTRADPPARPLGWAGRAPERSPPD